MPTYPAIQATIVSAGGRSVKTCWIAHVKEQCGIPMGPSRRTGPRKHPCPPSAFPRIISAFRTLGMI